jgi:manganese transport protein
MRYFPFSLKFPLTATAPFCPSEIKGTVQVAPGASAWQRFRRYAGVGFLISVGYMDPGNWATDIEAGSRYGYSLLSVVLISSLIAMLLQALCVRLGLGAGKDLAQLCRERFHPKLNLAMWFFAEVAIVACDFAEVLGTALAIKLLFGLPLVYGILLTALDTVIVLALQGRGVMNIEAIVIGLVATISAVFAIEIVMSQPHWAAVAAGFVPQPLLFRDGQAAFIAVGILGATVMPHNLYLHSSAVGTRRIAPGDAARADAMRLMTYDTYATLGLAFLVNAAILILAASAFHFRGHTDVKDIGDAYYLLAPIFGTAAASTLFAVALFASGQSSTLTGTIAGQVIFQGFLNVSIPCWQQRLLTRTLAIVPAWIGIVTLGEQGLGKLLVLSQVVLSMQLPFAVVPLILFCRDARIMGGWRIGTMLAILSWLICAAIIAANIFLILQML